MRFRFQYKMILKVGRVQRLGSGSFLGEIFDAFAADQRKAAAAPVAVFLFFLHRKVLILAVDL
jgi:hypothetical protein